MRSHLLLPLVLPLMAAAPAGQFSTLSPMPNFGTRTPQAAPRPAAPSGYTEAPTPNQDAFAPITRASRDASLSPGLFSRRDQYRGEGISPSSSAQIEEERRVKPGAGIKLSMPLE